MGSYRAGESACPTKPPSTLRHLPGLVGQALSPARKASHNLRSELRCKASMKTLLTTLSALAAVTALALLLPRGSSAPVPAPPPRAAFLVRFGLDAKAEVDWSGSITAAGGRVLPWQFMGSDALTGN